MTSRVITKSSSRECTLAGTGWTVHPSRRPASRAHVLNLLATMRHRAQDRSHAEALQDSSTPAPKTPGELFHRAKKRRKTTTPGQKKSRVKRSPALKRKKKKSLYDPTRDLRLGRHVRVRVDEAGLPLMNAPDVGDDCTTRNEIWERGKVEARRYLRIFQRLDSPTQHCFDILHTEQPTGSS